MAKAAQLTADASPEKRLFISLLTRDITLVDAVLDLIDNSINSAIIQSRANLSKPQDYISLLKKKPKRKLASVSLTFDENHFQIADTCGGISLKHAEDDVFRFGKELSASEDDTDNRLSVYGIGLKRAIFKIGDHVEMRSGHPKDGFELDLNVKAWERLVQDKWEFPITRHRGKLDGAFGTKIEIRDLYPDIRRRIADGSFERDLSNRIARSYNYFLQRVVSVSVKGKVIEPIDIAFGENVAAQSFVLNEVSCAVMAGISIPKGKFHTAEVAGWYIFCNGRAVAFADKTALTGWGTFLPNFQPKHRPFIGLVFFTSEQPEKLPWTTTKSSINQESAIWQHALRVMGTTGKQITGYLDKRYSEDGTDITTDELSQVAGRPESALAAISTRPRTFQTVKKKKNTTSIQFSVKVSEVDEIRSYLGQRSMSNSEVGRHTFDYFLENVVRE
jgi:Histidine kinase-, DNA gyrase B-, and HSP90-like ATPase